MAGCGTRLGCCSVFPPAALQAAGLLFEKTNLLVLSWGFSAAFYLLVVGYLLTYALRREVLTMDKLYGAAAAFIMLGGPLDLLLRHPSGGPSWGVDDGRYADFRRDGQHPHVSSVSRR